ncbi:MAG: ABC transporter permease [Anaerolineae bacterium]
MKVWPRAVPGLVLLCLLCLGILLGPWFSPYDPFQPDPAAGLMPPGSKHLLGTDALGRDTLSRLLYGARYSFFLPLLATIVASVAGGLVGATSGFLGGKLDSILVRALDTIATVPVYILALALLGVTGPGMLPLAGVLIVTGAASYARLARIVAIGQRNQLYVTAAIAVGARPLHIILRHVVPHVIRPLWAQSALGVGHNVLLMAGLGFLGVGVQPPEPEWGVMVYQARAHLGSAPHLLWLPGLCIACTGLGFMLLGDVLSDR